MSAQSTVRVTSNIMLAQIAVILGSIALVAAGSSSTSVSNYHGGSYTYGIDHDNYGAWYGTAHPYGHLGLASGHGISGIYGHEALNHGVLSHDPLSGGEVSYGYDTYGPGYGYGDYGQVTIYQKKVGGETVQHSTHKVHHGHGATSYQSIYQKTGSGLYGGYGGDYGISHGYAGGYDHGNYGGGISSQNFNLKSYVHQPITYDVSAHHVPSYDTHVTTHGQVTVHDIGNYGDYSGGYGHFDSYGHGLHNSYNDDIHHAIHQPSYGHFLDLGNHGYSSLGYDSHGHDYSGYGNGYSGYGHGYSGYSHGYSGYGHGYNGYGHNYGPSYGAFSYY